ncbi:MAG: hypothetical protein NT129_00110 [Candidatus Aenigmarchaeota archaeon]|nr:hypothetical protein [Candidatus Aenigmarchaeota archaeon]
MQFMKAAKNAGLAASLLGILAATAIGCGNGKEADQLKAGDVLYVPQGAVQYEGGKALYNGTVGADKPGNILINGYMNYPGNNTELEKYKGNLADLAAELDNITITDAKARIAREDALKSQMKDIENKIAGTYQIGEDVFRLYVDYNLPKDKLKGVRDNIEGNESKGEIQLLEEPKESYILDREKLILLHPNQYEVNDIYSPSDLEQYDWNKIEGRTTTENPRLNDKWKVEAVEYDGGFDPLTGNQTSGIIRARVSRNGVTLKKDLMIETIVNSAVANRDIQIGIVNALNGKTIQILAEKPFYEYKSRNGRTCIAYSAKDIEIDDTSWN